MASCGVIVEENDIAKALGCPAGCVVIKSHDERVCELKRLYVRVAFRGRGLGEQLSALRSMRRAPSGISEWFSTVISMRSAHAIYRSLGFGFVDAPADFPERFKPVILFMERDLSRACGAPLDGA